MKLWAHSAWHRHPRFSVALCQCAGYWRSTIYLVVFTWWCSLDQSWYWCACLCCSHTSHFSVAIPKVFKNGSMTSSLLLKGVINACLGTVVWPAPHPVTYPTLASQLSWHCTAPDICTVAWEPRPGGCLGPLDITVMSIIILCASPGTEPRHRAMKEACTGTCWVCIGSM